MKPARCALHGGRRGVLYFCLHISDILSVKKRRGFEQEGTDNGVFSLLPPRPPVPRTIHLRREIDRMNRIQQRKKRELRDHRPAKGETSADSQQEEGTDRGTGIGIGNCKLKICHWSLAQGA